MQTFLQHPSDHDQNAPPVQVKGLSLQYDSGGYALRDLSFSLQAFQMTAVVGPNGAGKTTLFKLISGTLRPSSGSIDVYGEGPGKHICIAYVPQRSQVDLEFPVTVREVVMMGRIRKIGFFRWPTAHDWELVLAALIRVGMEEYADRQIGALSGGQQQRVFLAQAISQEAEVVLLDEPLTGLDLPSQEAIFGIMQTMRDGGTAVLVATHDLNLAAEHFDQVLLLNRRLIAFGAPKIVFSRDNLIKAYGAQVHVLSGADETVVLADTCCEGEEPHSHG
ncbi:MAG: metal ABC transporter ATP-binding protein [Anaerolineales bacterium]|nr:metal ABC transporter ATP-binding protein [Anaerolineales bacterium]